MLLNYEKFRKLLLEESILDEAAQEVNAESPDDPNSQGGRNLSDDQVMQIVQGLQNGQITEEEIQKQVESGQVTEEDIQAIQNAMQDNADDETDGEDPENIENTFDQEIDQLTNNFIRLNLYDKINELIEKLDNFMESYTEVNDEIVSKLEQVKNYLNILGSLIYNLDVNLLYQLYITLEMKSIDILRNKLDIGPDPDFISMFGALEKQVDINKKRAEYSKTKIINGLVTGEFTEDDLKDLIKRNVYSQGEVDEMLKLAQKGGPQKLDDQKVDQYSDALKNQQIGQDEIEQEVDKGNMSIKDVENISKEYQNDEQTSSALRQILGNLGIPENQQQPEQQPQGEQPEQPQGEQPEQPQGEQPEQPQGEQPVQPQGEQPEQPQGEQPEQPQGLSSDQLNQIIQGLQSGEIQPEEIQQAIESGQISEEDIQAIQSVMQGEQPEQPEQQPQGEQRPEQQPQGEQPQGEQPQGEQQLEQPQQQENDRKLTDDQILDISKAINSQQLSVDELSQKLFNDQLTSEDFKKIIEIVKQLKSK